MRKNSNIMNHCCGCYQVSSFNYVIYEHSNVSFVSIIVAVLHLDEASFSLNLAASRMCYVMT